MWLNLLFSAPMMERMKLTDLSAKSSYIVYLTATLNRNTKETLKYEPLRIYPERVCTFYQDETEGGHHRALYNNETDRTNNFYDFNQLKWRMSLRGDERSEGHDCWCRWWLLLWRVVFIEDWTRLLRLILLIYLGYNALCSINIILHIMWFKSFAITHLSYKRSI